MEKIIFMYKNFLTNFLLKNLVYLCHKLINFDGQDYC